MKTFYGGTYLDKNILEENHIFYPVRLEYYKIQNEEGYETSYGIEIVKTEYWKGEPNIETEQMKNITQDEAEIVTLLEKIKRGTVMPKFLKETVQDQKEEKLCWK